MNGQINIPTGVVVVVVVAVLGFYAYDQFEAQIQAAVDWLAAAWEWVQNRPR